MKVYLVGGACRDMIMGLPPKDHDYVVVGSSPEEMMELGFKKVGADFPVFLHPETGDEYALARTERKSGEGYKGFDCNWEGVTLEEDLHRRDLTMNAISREVDYNASVTACKPIFKGSWIDPYNGIPDIEKKVLRAVSEHFDEDPLRVLRVARFMSRYGDFELSGSLLHRLIQIAKSGELGSLTPERVWLETEKALSENKPERYFKLLFSLCTAYDVDLFKPLFDLHKVDGKNAYHQEENTFIHTMMVVSYAKEHFNDPEITLASVLHDTGKLPTFLEYGNCHGHEEAGIPIIEEFCKEYKVPNNYRDLAMITSKQHLKCHNILGRGNNKASRPKSIMKMFEETSAMTKPERFKKMLKACEADAKGRIGISANDDYVQRQYLEECLEAVINLNTKSISKELLDKGVEGVKIGEAIRVARIGAIRGVFNKWR